ncbi:MAG: hypothetical protein A2Y40_06200 [Candidatus Margulisbacteria bacterium GWF2_35_9]|nr:MAG: hypothetical protein A2Y40_06200 [Candidatus Margulisbacteria bacterium GWF2_35_9]
MSDKISHMLVVNLHEIDFLERTLNILAEEYVRDCVVYDAEGIISRHGDNIPIQGFIKSGLSSLFKEKRNQNYVIFAVVKEALKENVSIKLKSLHYDNRWAASFWFVPIEGYFYHKEIA